MSKKKAFLVCGLLTVFYLAFSSYLYLDYRTPNNTSDFENHWNGIHGSHQESYPTGYYALFSNFAQNKEVFFAVNVLLICFVLPLLLFKLTKTWWVTIIYFFATGLPHQWLFGATFPQAFVFFLIVIYFLKRKNLIVFCLCAMLAGAVHHQGLVLFALIFGAEVFDFFLKKKKNIWAIIPALPASRLSITSLPSVFALSLTIPLLWLGRKIVKNYFLLFLAIMGVIASFSDLRAISLTQFSLIIVAAQGLKDSPNKSFWCGALILQGIFIISVFGIETIKTIALNM